MGIPDEKWVKQIESRLTRLEEEQKRLKEQIAQILRQREQRKPGIGRKGAEAQRGL